jgi:hypothetical protein
MLNASTQKANTDLVAVDTAVDLVERTLYSSVDGTLA